MEVITMKRINVLGAALLALLMAGTGSVFAQEEEKAPPQAEPAAKPAPERPQQEKPEPQPEQPEVKPPQQQEKRDRQEQRQEQKQEQKDDKQVQKEQQKDEKQSKDEKKDAKTVKQETVPRGGHIPDDQFRSHFGRQHTFRISRPVIVEGSPRFQYAGYTFVVVDPWPAGWSYNDAVYIDFIGGVYYLCDPLYPGVQITLTVLG
jgi:flagellar motor protein MotB